MNIFIILNKKKHHSNPKTVCQSKILSFKTNMKSQQIVRYYVKYQMIPNFNILDRKYIESKIMDKMHYFPLHCLHFIDLQIVTNNLKSSQETNPSG